MGGEELILLETLMEDCAAQADDCIDKKEAQSLKIIAILVILLGCVVGVCMPVLGRSFYFLRVESKFFFVLKGFAAGVILATAFIHMLPDAFESLANPCLLESPYGHTFESFPFAGFITMMSALLTLLLEFSGTAYYHHHNLHPPPPPPSGAASSSSPVGPNKTAPQLSPLRQDEEHASEIGKNNVSINDVADLSLRIRHPIVSQVLELGIVAHSVIIGISLGSSNSPCTIRPLVAALAFHQFFEGIALGGCIAQAGFEKRSAIMMAIFFSITTPFGIGIGMAISSTYNENSPRSLIVQGVFDSISSGILIYMSLVDLIGIDFLSERLRRSRLLQLLSFSSLFLGTGVMSLIAKWA